jgi:hypothetical protein
MWPQYLQNPEAVHGAFGADIPSLEGLALDLLMLDSAGGLGLALVLGALPNGSPARWGERGFDHLEFRFLFSEVSDLSIRGTPGGKGRMVSLALGSGEADLTCADAGFAAAFKFLGARAFLHPFNAHQRLDYQDSWYRAAIQGTGF